MKLRVPLGKLGTNSLYLISSPNPNACETSWSTLLSPRSPLPTVFYFAACTDVSHIHIGPHLAAEVACAGFDWLVLDSDAPSGLRISYASQRT